MAEAEEEEQERPLGPLPEGTGPGGRKTYMAGAAPSGCGKTTTAMVGTDFIGDDLAQLWVAEDGTVRAINPEKGIFGIVEDVNWDGDPLLMKCLRNPGTEVIWSNVLIDDNGLPHWVGNGEPAPEKGTLSGVGSERRRGKSFRPRRSTHAPGQGSQSPRHGAGMARGAPGSQRSMEPA